MRQAEYEFADEVSRIHGERERNDLVERAKNYIFQNLHGEIRIGGIGRQIGVSTAYLSDLFHRVEGVTIQQYIRRERVRLAENLLRYSDYTVKDIANYLAFSSQSHLGRVFKEMTGMTPGRYREKYKISRKNENK
nr:AraC family transcriptional regulator [Mediterraneibacter glycyrrhizinilyticus]